MKVFKNEFIQFKNDKKIVQYTKKKFQKVFSENAKYFFPVLKIF